MEKSPQMDFQLWYAATACQGVCSADYREKPAQAGFWPAVPAPTVSPDSPVRLPGFARYASACRCRYAHIVFVFRTMGSTAALAHSKRLLGACRSWSQSVCYVETVARKWRKALQTCRSLYHYWVRLAYENHGKQRDDGKEIFKRFQT